MTYAVNVCDVSNLGAPGAILLSKLSQGRRTVNAEPGVIDGDAVMVDNPDTEQVEAALHFLSQTAKNHRAVLRIYQQGPRGGWKRLPR